ncbi:MAG TPA: hypothetical protein VKB03_08045 [Conexibacter sp.]|nr:hypothetical protein [Conexibacter sp.]
MSDVFALRREADELRLALETAAADVDRQEVALQQLRRQIADGTFEGVHGHTPEDWLDIRERAQSGRREAMLETARQLDALNVQLRRALRAQPPLFAARNDEPIALLPVRLETRFADARTIQVRVYPDDLHIDAFEPRLTRAELRAARAYWRRPGEAAWQQLLSRLSPARAAWATRLARPGAPDPPLRRAGQRRAPQITTLPTRWRFVGLVGGETVVDRRGREIPNPLPLGVLLRDPPGADRRHATWLFDFRAAVQVGMAAVLRLPDGVEHLDELLVVGVQRSSAEVASQRLRDTLRGHAFGAGLGFLKPGTPTNNTPQSRSGWSSRPQPQPPARRRPRLAPGTDAARLASALGLPEAAFLAECQGAGETTEQALAGLTLLSWGALGQAVVEGAQGSDLVTGEFEEADMRMWRDVRDHLIAYVRSRGPLPTLRVGRQPYGILPATSLDEWEARRVQGASGPIADWLLRLRHHWRAALAPGWIPRVTDGAGADHVAVDVLSRLPTPIDVAVRRMLSPRAAREQFGPRSPGPAVAVSGIAPGANARWTVPTEQLSLLSLVGDATQPDYGQVMPRLDPDPEVFTDVLSASRELWRDALAVVGGRLSPADYRRRWPIDILRDPMTKGRRDTLAGILRDRPYPGLVPAMLHPDNWIFWPTDESDPLRAALQLPQSVDSIVTGQEVEVARPAARRGMRRARAVIDALAALEATPAERRLPLALEVLDVYSHRLDAWITSLATRRLLAMRERRTATRTRVGGYGWVENLRRDVDGRDVDGFVHAPSLHHAATAAVLRSGFRSNPDDTSLAVNLNSRRARVARWLLGGVRRGQELGALLGYRFERALHDAGLDELVDDFRDRYPAPVAPEPPQPPPAGTPPNQWERSAEAIAARNVVDGMKLARDAPTARGVSTAAAPFVDDVVDALDAVGDLLLAESVHQLVGGNPLRAGLAADTLGRGEDVPDRFDVLRTPHRARAITHRVAALLPDAPARPPGWADDALARLDPRVEAWVADALGPAAERRLEGMLRIPVAPGENDTPPADGAAPSVITREFARGADELGLGALSTALLASGADRTRLAARIRELEGAPADATVSFDGLAWRELRGVATRVRSLLAAAQPLLPAHVAAGERAEQVVPELGELRRRVLAFAATLPGRGDPDSAAGRLRALARNGRRALDETWLRAVNAALAEALGASVPVAPLLRGARLGPRPPLGPRRPAARPAAPTDAELADWARRVGAVRSTVRRWHELTLLTAASSGRPCPLGASQSPRRSAADPWIAGPFDPLHRPMARQHLLWHAPVPLAAGGPLAGLVLDEWVELLPGSDALAETKREGRTPVPPESELTGLTFHFDRPDAKAPQAILLAVPPNPKRGWTEDGLALVVRDTLELAKLRAVDLGDLPLLDDVLPAVAPQLQSPLGGVAHDWWSGEDQEG